MKTSTMAMLATGAALSAMLATPAFAQATAGTQAAGPQDTPPQTPLPQTTPADTTQAGTPPAEAAEDNGGIKDIIVTAQRREESVQKASVSIEVLSADAIRDSGVTQAKDLGTAVAGVQIGQGGAATQIYIRGVGDFGSTSATNPAVAFNLDGVYIARPAAIEGNFYDIERVEILKGPQGTLYGRNATGGAINVISNKPRLGVSEMQGSIEVGNYHKFETEAAVNLPLGDNLAVRFAAQIVNRGPYVTYNFDDDVHESVRGQILWKPDERLTLRAGADYIHVGGGGSGYVPLQNIVGADPWTSETDPRVIAYYNQRAVATGLCAPRGAPFPTSPGNLVSYSGACPNLVIPAGPVAGTYSQAQLVQPPAGEYGNTNNEFYSVFGQLDYDFGPVTLTVLPAYRSASLDYVAYPGLLRFDPSVDGKPERSKATSVEARLSHESESLKAVLGLYYFDEDQNGLASVRAGFVQSAIINQAIDTRNYAAFGQATYSITDRFRLIGGGRYTSDRRETAYQTYAVNDSAQFFQALAPRPVGLGCVPGLVPGTTDFIGCQTQNLSGKRTFKKFNYKAGAEFDLAPQNMVYATVSTGFKAGGFYGGTAPTGVGPGTYEPENLTAFEAGSRNRFFDNRVQLNFEGFYYKYKNHQEPVIIQDGVGQTTQAILNAGKGRVFGGSADLVFKPGRNDTFHFGVEYLDSKYTTFTYSSPIIVGAAGPQRFIFGNGQGTGCRLTETPTPLPATPTAGRYGYQVVDCSGFPLTRSPKWSGVASYSHVFELASGGNVEAKGDMQFASKRYLAADYLPDTLVGNYQRYNATLTYNLPGDAVSVSAFIRNITNEAVFTGSYKANFVTNFSGTSIDPPRTYGARLNFKF